jgi:saccharopine dehydrogenase-like NADP-dependent oxidoreductase
MSGYSLSTESDLLRQSLSYYGHNTGLILTSHRDVMVNSTGTASTISNLLTSRITGFLAVIASMVLFALLARNEIAADLVNIRPRQFSSTLIIRTAPLQAAFFLFVFINIAVLLN